MRDRYGEGIREEKGWNGGRPEITEGMRISGQKECMEQISGGRLKKIIRGRYREKHNEKIITPTFSRCFV